ncbi:MAG TPA: co-chaperone GroES [Gemmatimonadetes bacterium]|nr:co-chaperone GroES [Gemmatimonadota bacterium]
MSEKKKRLIVVGDRVLIQPKEGEDRTKVGLYLPATAMDSQAVQGGTVVATGPGNAISAPHLGMRYWPTRHQPNGGAWHSDYTGQLTREEPSSASC